MKNTITMVSTDNKPTGVLNRIASISRPPLHTHDELMLGGNGLIGIDIKQKLERKIPA